MMTRSVKRAELHKNNNLARLNKAKDMMMTDILKPAQKHLNQFINQVILNILYYYTNKFNKIVK